MKKLCNYRPIVLFCIALILGISLSLMAKTSMAAKIALITIFVGVLITWCVLFVIDKTRQLAIKHLSKFIVVIVAIAIGCLSVFIQFSNVQKSQVEKGTYTVYARVCSNVKVNSYNKSVFEVDNITAVTKDSRNELNGKMRVSLYSSNTNIDLEIGDYVELSGTLLSIDENLESDIDINNVGNNIYYKMYVSNNNIVSLGKNETYLNEKIQKRVWELLSTNMDIESASVAYSMFLGDTAFVDEDTLQDFRDSGLAHLLAVSGLHVGFLVALLSFICRKLKCNKYVEFAIIFVFMFLYALLCGFSSSVFRAFVMTTILLYAKLRYKEYDSLNSISLAAIIILLINPLKLWNVGFQLSFFAVLGIALLSKPIEDIICKVFNKTGANTFSVMLAVQCGIIVPMIISFNSFSILSLLANIIAIPLASVVFCVLFLAILISLIMPFMSFLLIAAKYVVLPLVWLSNIIASVPFAVVNAKIGKVALVGSSVALVAMSDYTFIKNKYKIIIAALAGVALICCVII